MKSILRQSAFTLVELSIVLVILGLLIGGVLTGQSLIRAAELRSVSTQQQRYVTAVQTFRDKYFALPGDMANAQSYWGIADPTPATCKTTASSTAVTCNGDANGQLSPSTGSEERFRFWQHLANAGLIEGSYDGIVHGSVSGSTNANVPVGRISSSLWFANYWGPLTSSSGFFDGSYGNALEIGGVVASNFPSGAIFKPEEAYNIDTKVDDGKPATGKVVQYAALAGTSTSCTDAAASAYTALGSNYLLTNTALSCAIIYREAF